MNLAQLEEKKAEIAGSYVDLERERGQLDEQVREISGSQAALKQETTALEEKNTLSGQAVEEKTAALEEAKSSRETLSLIHI